MQSITKETLQSWLGLPDLFLMDVRSQQAWNKSPAKIPRACRFEPGKINRLAKDIPKKKKLVLYCENGKTECPNFAQELENMGFPKVFILEGGWHAWLGKELPTVPKELD